MSPGGGVFLTMAGGTGDWVLGGIGSRLPIGDLLGYTGTAAMTITDGVPSVIIIGLL